MATRRSALWALVPPSPGIPTATRSISPSGSRCTSFTNWVLYARGEWNQGQQLQEMAVW
jgi:hypothetical protein